MAQRKSKKLIWTDEATHNLLQIMDFWLEHNKSATYSLKLKREIDKILSQACLQSGMGKQTNQTGIRVLVKGNYQIFYRDLENAVLVLHIWDSRRNPDELKL